MRKTNKVIEGEESPGPWWHLEANPRTTACEQTYLCFKNQRSQPRSRRARGKSVCYPEWELYCKVEPRLAVRLRQRHSRTHQVFQFVEYVSGNFNKKTMGAIFLEEELLYKLLHAKIYHRLVNIIASFLGDRCFKSLGGTRSMEHRNTTRLGVVDTPVFAIHHGHLENRD